MARAAYKTASAVLEVVYIGGSEVRVVAKGGYPSLFLKFLPKFALWQR